MGKHAGPEGYNPTRITEPPTGTTEDFDATLSDVQKELGILRLEDALGTLSPDARKRRMRTVITHLTRVGALGLVAVGVMVGGGVATAHSASAATVTSNAPSPTAPWIRHVAKFKLGKWAPLGAGYIGVSAPLVEYVPGYGWVPSPHEPVQVQEYKCGRWILRATLYTGPTGVADGMVSLGEGRHVVRVVHYSDAWTLRATGSTRYVYVTGDPLTD